jgi:hypothetical protein
MDKQVERDRYKFLEGTQDFGREKMRKFGRK